MFEMYALRLKNDYKNLIKMGLMVTIVIITVYWYNYVPSLNGQIYTAKDTCDTHELRHLGKAKKCYYQVRYPLSKPLLVTNGVSYKIAIVADLDEERSKVPGVKFKWRSYMRYGHLVKYNTGLYAIDWEDGKITMTSKLNEKGRGFELSELCAFNGKLYTIDDRTGIIYQIVNNVAIPWVILQDGNGMNVKGFKGEWMTVKEGALFVGGLGKEWTTQKGEFVNYDPLFVKSISPSGVVVHHNWTDHYLKVREQANIHFPGYMIHEAVSWSHVKRRWYFLPRRMAKHKYNDQVDEKRGTNVLISCNDVFKDYKMVRVGNLYPTRGFSSFKFVPGTGDNIAVALKSEEVKNVIKSYILVFHVETGKVLLPETYIEEEKYEGIEFV